MPFEVCSLITGGAQSIQPRTYTVVRFPFGSGESYDPLNMHPAASPYDGSPTAKASPEAGLIWPAHDAWGTLTATMQWTDVARLAAGDRPTHFRHRFVRDPLGYTEDPANSTATSDHLPRPAGKGLTCKIKTWNLFVHPGVPLGYLVYHDAKVPLALELAEFKLSYWRESPTQLK